MSTRVPYSQQFTPEQTPLKRLIPALRQNAGKAGKLKKAIAAAFFKGKTSPEKLAGNTLIALKTYGIIDADGALAPFGKQLVAAQGDLPTAHTLLAKRLLDPFGGSNVTGAAAEALGRQWISVELDETYVQASHFRFEHTPLTGVEPHASAGKVNGVAPVEPLSLF